MSVLLSLTKRFHRNTCVFDSDIEYATSTKTETTASNSAVAAGSKVDIAARRSRAERDLCEEVQSLHSLTRAS